MNAFYVFVSLPLLLLFAGFNHAHGLTTFGKTNNNPPPKEPVPAKHCNSQLDCNTIKNTTCIDKKCLCGDNTNPMNGACSAPFKGPRHLCSKTDDCVDGAECLPKNDNKNSEKICQCLEGLEEIGARCGGESNMTILPGLILAIMVLTKSIN